MSYGLRKKEKEKEVLKNVPSGNKNNTVFFPGGIRT